MTYAKNDRVSLVDPCGMIVVGSVFGEISAGMAIFGVPVVSSGIDRAGRLSVNNRLQHTRQVVRPAAGSVG